MEPSSSQPCSRRRFLAAGGGALLAASAGAIPAARALAEEQGDAVRPRPPRGTADHCIFLWLGGGAAHIDTWDPKRKGDGRKVAGSAYAAINTALPGVQVCEHLQRCAPLLDRFVLFRTVHHDVIDEHAAAVNRLHTGRPTSGTVIYPSIGSVVVHERPAETRGVPGYVVMGYPNVTRGPGFLGARHGYVYLIETESGPAGLKRPDYISLERQARRQALLEQMRRGYRERHPGDAVIADYDAAVGEAFSLAEGEFSRAFELGKETQSLRESYGGEFGQRCLLARRLVERGVRFVEVAFNLNFINGTGWDTHNDGQRNQHVLIEELDRALSTLVVDLEKRGLLQRTLVVVGTEFGRPPEFDGGGGRGHHSKAFSVVAAGGGLKPGSVVGQTDELGKVIVSQPVSVPDLHATLYCALGIDPGKNLHDGDRPVPITDRGQPVRELFG